MPDYTPRQGEQLLSTMRTRYVDQGDGTHALVTSTSLRVDGAAISSANPVPVSDADVDLRTQSVEVYRARQGDVWCRWVNDKTSVAALTVLTDAPAAGGQPGIYYNLAVGETVYITQLCFELTTVSDDLRVELGYTDAVGGGGNFTPITPIFRAQTGANNFLEQAPLPYTLTPPLPVSYSAGARMSITIRAQGNDAAARFMVAYHGWREI